MSKEPLLHECANAFEQVIETAFHAAQSGTTLQEGAWGPREVVAHLAGWEAMANTRISQIAAGKQPFELPETPQLNDAINAMIVTVAGDQSLDVLCGMLRKIYQRNIRLLDMLDDALLQPGKYPYERTKSVIEHCQEHMEQLTSIIH